MPTQMPCKATRMTWRPMRTARTTRRISVESNTVSAAEAAAVKPCVPSAIPTVALASAGASLMPSPTISTRCPCCSSSLTMRTLSSGRQREITWSTCAISPICCATTSPSPVNRIVSLIPAARKSVERRDKFWTRNVFKDQESLDLFLHGNVATDLTTLDAPLAFGEEGGRYRDSKVLHEGTIADCYFNVIPCALPLHLPIGSLHRHSSLHTLAEDFLEIVSCTEG